jgi:tRNA pseudouridine-54 N-methylase
LRHIILLAPSKAVSSEGSGHISRFVVGALLLSHGARRDVRLDLVFDGERCISFDGGSMRNVRPDEQSLSGILRAGLRRLNDKGEGRIMQGINTFNSALEELLEGAKGIRLYYTGVGGKSSGCGDEFCAFFQFPSLEGETEGKLRKVGFQSINLGGCQLYPDQAVVLLHNKADRHRVH